MALVWSSKVATGLNWQDAQHQELFRRANQLLDAMKAGQAPAAAGEVLSFLEKYVVEHFGNEEAFMKRNGMAVYAQHKAAHEEFVKAFGELKTAFLKGGASTTVSLKLQSLLSDWLVKHIGTMDKAFADQTLTMKLK